MMKGNGGPTAAEAALSHPTGQARRLSYKTLFHPAGQARRLSYERLTMTRSRREFLRDVGLSAAALPFVLNLPSLGFANQRARKQRLVVMFSPDGVVPWNFWPDEEGPEFTLKESLTPLEGLKD